MKKSNSSWSNLISKKIFYVTFACLVLSSPAWILQTDALNFANCAIHTVDPEWKTGSYVCLALDSKGNPGISYYDFNNTHLKYAYWTGTNWSIQTVDPNGFNGLHTSVAFDSKDLPHISYMSQNTTNYAHWNGTAWNIQAIGASGGFTSIAIDANDNPHISYFGVAAGANLEYVVWNGSTWNNQTIDSKGITGEFTSLKLDSSGFAHISYLDVTNQTLKVAWQDSSGWHIQVVDASGAVGWYSSLALDSKGNSHISYFDNASRDLKYAESNGSNWTIQTIDSSGDVGTDTSIALDSHDNPHISYTDTTNHVLKYASWNGSKWDIKTLPLAGYVGEYTSLPNDQTSLQIDKYDIAHLAYCDWGHYCLKYITAPDASDFVFYVQPIATLSVAPNPVAVGQTITLVLSIAPLPPTLPPIFTNITLKATNSDGTSLYLGPFLSNSTGFIAVPFVPTQVGNMTFQASVSSQVCPSVNTTFLPTQSNTVTLLVQENLTSSSPPPSPTPTASPSPTNSPTQNSTSTTTQSTQYSSNYYWQDDQQYSQSTDWNDNSSDTGYQQETQQHAFLDGPFPIVEAVITSVVAFSITVGVILFLKRWE